MSSVDHKLDFYLDQIDFVGAEKPLGFVDVWNFQDGRDPIINVGTVQEVDVTQWLQNGPPMEDQERPIGGLRLLISSRLHDKAFAKSLLEIRRSTFIQLIKSLNLPLAYVAAVARQGGMHSRIRGVDNQSNELPCIVYIIKPPPGAFYFLECVLSHDPNSNDTRGFLRSNIPGASDYFLRQIRSSTAVISHPLFLAAVYSEWQAEMVSKNCIGIGSKLIEIEALTGHTAYRDLSPFTKGHGLFCPVKDPDHYRLLTYALSQANYHVASTELFASSLRDFCKFALDSFKHDLREAPKQRKASVQYDTNLLRQRIVSAASSSYHSQLQVRMYRMRTKFQISVVYNLIAQEESVRNIEVAKDSKNIASASRRESMSMRTIAVLSTIFLPGTFIATFFALPLFDWDAPHNRDVVKARFWIFWAVTIPLTLTVIGVWWLWMRWCEESDRIRDISARGVRRQNMSEDSSLRSTAR